MVPLALFLLVQLLTAQGLYYTSYPILPSYDRDIPEDVREVFSLVGVVVEKRSLKPTHQSLKLRTVGAYFTDGEYGDIWKGSKLCDDSIANTPAVFVCGTGSIIGRNQFITAYHVAEDLTGDRSLGNVKNLYIVFNYRQKTSGSFEKQRVYQVARVVDKNEEEDWVILQTTEKFTHNKGKTFQLASDLPYPKERLYILGHPLGTPLRYANGEVLDVDKNANIGLKFISSGFSGNSGSPVVRLSDGKVIGLFASYPDDDDKKGTNDFVWNKNCYAIKISNPDNPIAIKGPLSVKLMSAKFMSAIDEQHEEL